MNIMVSSSNFLSEGKDLNEQIKIQNKHKIWSFVYFDH
jgi:hypothetical protein